MRRLFWQISMTLDGWMAGPRDELDDTAQISDPDFDRYAFARLQSIDDIVLGRRTYELFRDYWPGATGPDAERMNSLRKLELGRVESPLLDLESPVLTIPAARREPTMAARMAASTRSSPLLPGR